ncbi:MAG: hypothetical protein R3346_04740 [Candidatus Spechtbacterales bacterium]|nr:hypothetical protein [Candidatus Spechtbacterales bacterium]
MDKTKKSPFGGFLIDKNVSSKINTWVVAQSQSPQNAFGPPSAASPWKKVRAPNLLKRCNKSRDLKCKDQSYINEKDLIKELKKLVDELSLDQVKVEGRIAREIERYQRFERMVLGKKKKAPVSTELSAKKYMKYILQNGKDFEKREMILCIKSQLYLKDRKIYLE